MRSFVLFYSLLMCTLLCAVVGCHQPEPDPVAEVALPDVLARGKFLVHGPAACGNCHGATREPGAALTGGRTVYDTLGAVVAPNLTQLPGGLADWKATDVQQLFRASLRPDGSEISVDVHRGYEWMADQDLIAIISYLRSLKADGILQERRDVSFIDRNTKGFWQSRRDVRGYVPQISKSFPIDYGKYLVDSIARCGSCHNQPGGVMTDTVYLAGGAEIRVDDETKIAPGLTISSEVGIGTWSEDDIFTYLRTGKIPSGDFVDRKFCPVQFFALAEDGDLRSIAKYLKTVQ